MYTKQQKQDSKLYGTSVILTYHNKKQHTSSSISRHQDHKKNVWKKWGKGGGQKTEGGGEVCVERDWDGEFSLIYRTMKVKIQIQTIKRQYEIQTDLNKFFLVTQLDYRIMYQKTIKQTFRNMNITDFSALERMSFKILKIPLPQ